jgi:formylglycine-generating enzyme required for sulfatase activity
VFVAEDTVLARPVAIKLINNLDPASRQRFLLEARAVAQIHHPNVVGIYRVGTYQHRPYFVTELVRGPTLAEISRPIAPQVALDIAIGMARGLAAAHRRNVVHCDLKPSNVMIDLEGVAKIIDFGLARVAVEGTTAGLPVGTPDYMAPEVWAGEAPGRRADVYSLGAVVFELFAGAPPFADVAPDDLRARVTTGEAPALRDRAPDVDPALAEIVARCLRRDRAARFADGDELREALEHLHAAARPPVRTGHGDENPYRGLLPFEASHRGVFFGRRAEVDSVIARLRSDPILLVTGDSGVGKSSLCRAGVVPAIVDGELGGAWRALTIVPGARPLTALASALGVPTRTLADHPGQLTRELRRRAGDDGLVVFVDQLEELITVGDPDEVAALDAGLAGFYDGVPGLRLLATVRADFLARISTLPGLGRDLSRALYFLRPMPTARLREVIVGPATSAGARFESDEIVDELAAAAAQAESGGLPLLSFALADLWDARDRNQMISRAAVTAMGGVAGALSRHADIVISGMMAPRERAHARRLVLRLVTPMGTRARRTAHELELGDASSDALDALINGRLVVVHDGEPEPTYELAHECLLTGWPTLRQWLDDDTADRAARERLAAAAAEWARLGRNSEATWQGTRLAKAIALDPQTLSTDDRAFVFASQRAARRRSWQRGLTVFGAIALAATAFTAQRYLVRRELTAAVNGELAVAQDARREAELADHLHAELARRAYEQFDALDWKTGEKTWKQAVDQHDSAERNYREASEHVERAVVKDPSRGDLRDLLGDLLLARATLAEQAYEIHERDELVTRIALYDADKSRRAARARPGRLIIHAHGAAIKLAPMPTMFDNPELPRGHEPPRVLGTGDVDVREPPGSYLVELTAPDRVTVHAPILLERGGELTLDIAPPRAADVPPGMIYVPAGVFLYGNANDDDRESLYATTPLHPRTTPAFLIGRNEVTFGDWLAFIDALPPAQRAGLLPTVPAKLLGGIEVIPDAGGHWRIEMWLGERHYSAGWGESIVYAGRTYHETQDWRQFPVVGVTAHAALAYAAWLDRTGRLPGARLCSEVEWERAARGADGRPYPGDHKLTANDANIDVAHPRLMGPDEVGAHPTSRSPFGLDDTIGNAFEWTRSEPILASEPASGDAHNPDDGYILRGGSYQHDRKTAHLTNRAPMPGSLTDPSVGVRLCATPPLPQ